MIRRLPGTSPHRIRALALAATALALVGALAAPRAEATYYGKAGGIAFFRFAPPASLGQVMTMNPGGGGQRDLVPTSPESYGGDGLAFSANGMLAVSLTDSAGYFDVFYGRADGSGLVNITNTALQSEYADALSRDGRTVIFTASTTTTLDVFRMNSDGSGRQNLTSSAAADFTARLSPDGKRILFTRDVDPGPSFSAQILSMNSADGGDVRQLTSGYVRADVSDVSPDGKRVLFSAETQPNQPDIWVMNPDGSGQRPLVASGAIESGPVFSPDQSRVLFSRDTDGDTYEDEILAAGLDGSRPVNLTNNGVEILDVGPQQAPIPVRCAKKLATVVGTEGRDKLRGTARKDVIVGLGGRDTLKGLGGNDILCGGKGRDKLIGGPGADLLTGGKGRDVLKGGKGKDREKQ